jgi:hypothetical protein
MDGMTCDLCGAALLVETEVRYEVKIEVKCAYDPLEITDEDLRMNHEAEMKRLLGQMEGMSPQELEEQVYKAFRFDLCPRCQRAYIRDPLKRTGPTSLGE